VADWEYDMFGCTSCGSAFCDGACPDAYKDYEREQEAIARHVATCKADECYVCQCL